jgi:hypothetical protein
MDEQKPDMIEDAKKILAKPDAVQGAGWLSRKLLLVIIGIGVGILKSKGYLQMSDSDFIALCSLILGYNAANILQDRFLK